MLVNQRLRDIRRYRRLEGQEMAKLAGLSPSEVSLLEKKMRTPKIDTLQRLAAALDVTAGYLLGEVDGELPLPQALARQSFTVFLQHNQISLEDQEYLQRISVLASAPQTVRGWRDLLRNVEERLR